MMTTKSPGQVIGDLVAGCRVILTNSQQAVVGVKASTVPEKRKDIAETLAKSSEHANDLASSMRHLARNFPSLPSAFQKAFSCATTLAADAASLLSVYNTYVLSDTAGTPTAISEVEGQLKKVSTAIRELLLAVQAWNASQHQQGVLTDSPVRKYPIVSDLCSALGKKVKELYACAVAGNETSFTFVKKETSALLQCLVSWAREAKLPEEERLVEETGQRLLVEAQSRFQGETDDQQLLQTIKKAIEALSSLSQKVKSQSIEAARQQDITKLVCSDEILRTVPIKQHEKPPAELLEDPKVKRERMRANALRELMDSETLYFTQLKTLIMQFISPLEKSGHKIMSNRTIADQFTDITTIDALTKKVLSDLKNILANSTGGNQEVGEVFVFLAPVFKLYMRYINNYEKFNSEFLECRKKFNDVEDKAKKFCEFTAQNDISFYFILPIQRLPRYEMLLAAIAKYTDENHPDYANLSNALKEVKKVNDWINEKKREEENRTKMFEVERAISGGKSKIEIPSLTNRILIRSGTVIDGTSRTRRKISLFMLNDLLLVARVKNTQASLIDSVPFSRCTIRPATDKDTSFEIVQHVTNMAKPKVHHFMCASEAEKNSWIQGISDAININVLMDQVGESENDQAGLNGGLRVLAQQKAGSSQTLPRHFKAGDGTRGRAPSSPTPITQQIPQTATPQRSATISVNPLHPSAVGGYASPTSSSPMSLSPSSTQPTPLHSSPSKFAAALTLRPQNKTTMSGHEGQQVDDPSGGLLRPKPKKTATSVTAADLFPISVPNQFN